MSLHDFERLAFVAEIKPEFFSIVMFHCLHKLIWRLQLQQRI